MRYRVEFDTAAERDLKELPREVRREIYDIHLPKIQADPNATGEQLHGDLAGFRSYHFGHRPEYRMLYKITDDLVVIWIVDTRESVYKKAKRRLS